ncbi:MAG: hypothetical protein U0U09_18635 [Cyclobacteriaceae bacterium]|mgnify:CR=1 FL=1
MEPVERSKEMQQDGQSKPKRPPTLLSDEEIEAGDRAFVELVKARDRKIAEVKKAKGISDGDH